MLTIISLLKQVLLWWAETSASHQTHGERWQREPDAVYMGRSLGGGCTETVAGKGCRGSSSRWGFCWCWITGSFERPAQQLWQWGALHGGRISCRRFRVSCVQQICIFCVLVAALKEIEDASTGYTHFGNILLSLCVNGSSFSRHLWAILAHLFHFNFGFFRFQDGLQVQLHYEQHHSRNWGERGKKRF